MTLLSKELTPGDRTPAAVLTATGWGSVVLGGLVAAVTGPLELADGSWLAAYLVLVGGVAQVFMAAARSWRRRETRGANDAWWQVGTWNLGHLAVIGGTLMDEPLVVDVGSLSLLVAVAIAAHAARPSVIEATVPSVIRWSYWALLAVLLVSIPIGMVLAHLRHG